MLCLAFSTDGALLASGSADGTVRVWRVTDGKNVATFAGHTARVLGVGFSTDGKTVWSGSADKTMKLWSLATGRDGEVLVHLGSSDYLERYRIYIAHVQEWRQQFDKLESVDLRYEHQIVVNPDLRGMKQPPLSSAAAKAAIAAGVKPAALLTRVATGPKPASLTIKSAPKPTKKWAKPRKRRVAPAFRGASRQRPLTNATLSTTTATATKPRKPSPAIMKQQDHP